MTEPAHAKLGPSAAAKWMTCTAAPGLEATLPPEEESVFAAEGTYWHEWAEHELGARLGIITSRQKTLRLNKLRKSDDGEKFWSIDGQRHVERYADLVMEEVADLGDEFQFGLVEVRVRLGAWIDGSFGTTDCVLIADNSIHVIDLKMGQGVPVSAVENPQAMLYGLGAIYEYGQVYDFEEVVMTIIQPRLNSISTYKMQVSDLLAWGEEAVKPAALAASSGDGAEFKPSESACRWCVAKAVCRPRMEAAVAEDFGDLTEAEVVEPGKADTLTLDELGAILSRLSAIESWVKDVKALTLAEAKAGKKLPGWKLVEGRPIRKIVDQDKAREKLAAEGFLPAEYLEPQKLKTLTALNKVVPDLYDVLGDTVQKLEGAPTLAPESDKRPELGSAASAAADFAEEPL